MKPQPSRSKAAPVIALIAVVGVVVGAAAAFGSTAVPGSSLPQLVSWDGEGSGHAAVTDDRPVPGIDPEAPPPEVDRLWDAYRSTQRCLEAEGFGFVGPVPLSDGSGLQYLVSSPADGPQLAPSNACEDPLKSDAAAFSRSAPAAARQALADEFRSTMRCLGIHDAQLGADVDGTELERNLDLEQQVMTQLMESAEANDACSGPQR